MEWAAGTLWSGPCLSLLAMLWALHMCLLASSSGSCLFQQLRRKRDHLSAESLSRISTLLSGWVLSGLVPTSQTNHGGRGEGQTDSVVSECSGLTFGNRRQECVAPGGGCVAEM